MFTPQLKTTSDTTIPKTEDRNGKTLPAVPLSGTVQKKENRANNTGLPDNLKNGVEQLSGYSLDDVKVHYNSDRPVQLQALAYAQGNDIHVGPGQEQHLPHEAWHVVQQKQGRVQPTLQMKTGVPVNDDKGLESEADIMGQKASVFDANSLGIAGFGQTDGVKQMVSTPNRTYQLLRREEFRQIEATFRAGNWQAFYKSQSNVQNGLPYDHLEAPKSMEKESKSELRPASVFRAESIASASPLRSRGVRSTIVREKESLTASASPRPASVTPSSKLSLTETEEEERAVASSLSRPVKEKERLALPSSSPKMKSMEDEFIEEVRPASSSLLPKPTRGTRSITPSPEFPSVETEEDETPSLPSFSLLRSTRGIRSITPSPELSLIDKKADERPASSPFLSRKSTKAVRSITSPVRTSLMDKESKEEAGSFPIISSGSPIIFNDDEESPALTTASSMQASDQDKGKKISKDEMHGDEYGFTTFGMEYEMIPYANSNDLIANTAHVKLAIGKSMPFKPFSELLVTDSDNVIEYVTPVFLIPYEVGGNLLTQTTNKIKIIRKLLIDLKNSVKKHHSFGALIASEEMGFTTWTILDKDREKNNGAYFGVTHKEIDEKTDVPKLKAALAFKDSLPAEEQEELIKNIVLKSNSKNEKHKELNRAQTGSALQSTILLPLDLVAKIAKNLLTPSASTGSISSKKKKSDIPAPISASSNPIVNELIDILKTSIGNKENGESVLNLIHLFGQRMELVLSAPNAVKFQSYYQSVRFNSVTVSDHHKVKKTDGDRREENKKKKEEEEALMEDAPEELAAYRKEEAEYNNPVTKGNLNNFHNAHSGIKDRIVIWTRIHMDDLVKQLAKKLGPGDRKNLAAYIKEKAAKSAIWGKIMPLVYSTEPHRTVPFLEEDPSYVDLRQDTLRDLQIINGTAWVLVEIRNLQDKTLADILKNSVSK